MNTAPTKNSAVITIGRRLAPSLAWVLPLLALLALVGWDAAARIQRSLELSSHYGVAVLAPELDPTSPTGYALERRSLLTPILAPDTLHWIMQTQQMAARGDLRVRHVDYDNAPAGRAVHWAAPYRWWLLGLAHLDRTCLGTPLPLAIERSVLWAGPAMLVLALAIAVPGLVRRCGALAALVFAVGLLSCSPFSVQFIAGNADHHAPVTLCAMATVALLLAGRAPDAARVPRWHIASAMAGALGLWLSAATMIPVLVGIGLGGVVASLWIRRAARGVDPSAAARAWRWWGAVGGSATLLAWMLEYAPGNLGWRLEVIHPLYALAWWAGGELLCRITRRESGARARVDPRAILVAVLAAFALALPAIVILARGTEVFLVADTFLQALHGDTIAEFQSLGHFLSGRAVDLDLFGRLAPVALFLAAVVFLVRRSADPAARRDLAISAGAAAVMLVLAAMQIRWWGLASGLGLVVVALAVAQVTAKRERWIAGAAALLLLAPGIVQAIRSASVAGEPTESDVRRLAGRDVAHRLRLRAGTDPLVIAATPEETTSLIYFAGARGLGTLYWENVDGLKTIAAILGARTPDAAHELIVRAGVTHIALFPWDPSDEHCIRLHRGLTAMAPVPTDAFSVALRHGRVPPWLKPLPHRLPDHPLLRGQVVRLFEVTAPRSPERVAVDAAAYLMDMGRADEAAALEPELARFPGDLAAQATLAAMQARRKDARAFGATLQRVLGSLDQSESLPLEDRLRVVMTLAIAGQEARAASELQHALAAADERAVRRMSPGSLSDLFELTSALGVAWPDAALRQLAGDLAMRPQR